MSAVSTGALLLGKQPRHGLHQPKALATAEAHVVARSVQAGLGEVVEVLVPVSRRS